MDIIQKELTKTQDGFFTVISIQLSSVERSKIEGSYEHLLQYFKGYNLFLDDNILKIERNFKIMEPWEDETPEAVIKSVQMEIEYILKKIMD